MKHIRPAIVMIVAMTVITVADLSAADDRHCPGRVPVSGKRQPGPGRTEGLGSASSLPSPGERMMQRRKLLVIDNDPAIFRYLRRGLAPKGYDVAAAQVENMLSRIDRMATRCRDTGPRSAARQVAGPWSQFMAGQKIGTTAYNCHRSRGPRV